MNSNDVEFFKQLAVWLAGFGLLLVVAFYVIMGDGATGKPTYRGEYKTIYAQDAAGDMVQTTGSLE